MVERTDKPDRKVAAQANRYLHATIGDWRASPHFVRQVRSRHYWQKEEEDYVSTNYPTDKPVAEIAAFVGRTIGAVRSKARGLCLRRPQRGAPTAALPPIVETVPPSIRIIEERRPAFSRSASGRLIWDNPSRDLLHQYWRRLIAPALIATIAGVSSGTLSQAAYRFGLPSREGLTLVTTLPDDVDPLTLPASVVVDAITCRKLDRNNDCVFFVHPKNKNKIHRSAGDRKILVRA